MLLVSLSNPKYKQFEGKRMNEVIRAMGKPGIDTLFELLINNNGSVPTVYFHHSEDDMRYALRQPWVSIGSDGTAVTTEGPLAAGNPHPRYFGTFPARAGALCARRESDHDGRGDPKNDLGQRGQDPPVRSRVCCVPGWRRM